MQVDDEYIDELFARKLGSMEVMPPEDGWNRIESELNRRSRNSRRFWLTAASFALLLSVSASVIYLQTGKKSLHDRIASVAPENRSEQPQPEQQLPVGHENFPASKEVNRQPVSQQNRSENSTIPEKAPEAVSGKAATLPEQEKETLTAGNSTSEIPVSSGKAPVFADNPVPAAPFHPNIPVYNESGTEIARAKPINVNRVEYMSKKFSRQLPGTKATDSPVAGITPKVPVYDEVAFVDVSGAVTAKKHPRNRWEIMGQFAPMYSYRSIGKVPDGMRKSDFDEAESGLLAYSGGVTVSYKVVGRLSIQTGIFYSQMGQSINSVTPISNMYAAVSSNNLYAKNFVRTSSGNVTVASNMKSEVNTTYDSYFNTEARTSSTATNVSTSKVSDPVKYRLIERVDYLEIPLILRYKVIDRKLNLYLLGGMSTNILVDNNVFIDNGSDLIKEGTILMTRPVNYSSTLGMGLSYQITGNLLIDIEPSFKYYLQSYTASNQISSNPYSLGILTGVVYRF